MLENEYGFTKTTVANEKSNEKDTAEKSLDNFSQNYSNLTLKEVFDKYNISTTPSKTAEQLQDEKSVKRNYASLMQINETVVPQTEQTTIQEPQQNYAEPIQNKDVKLKQAKRNDNLFIKNKNAKPSLNFTGRLAITTYACVMILMGVLMVSNVATINNISANIDYLNQSIVQESENIADIKKVYSILNKADNLTDRATDSNMEPSTNNEYISLLSTSNGTTVTKETNWFNGLCDYLNGLFGG